MRAERETTDPALKEFNGEHARSVIKFVLERGAPCCTAFTNNTRYYARSSISACVLNVSLLGYIRVYKKNKARRVVRGGEGGEEGETC